MAQRFRKKTVIVEAVRWTGANRQEILDFVGSERVTFSASNPSPKPGEQYFILSTLMCEIAVFPGDYVVKEIHGGFLPYRPDWFAEAHEPVPDFLSSREILMEDVGNAMWAMERVESGKDAIWQNLVIWHLAKAVKDILLYLLGKEIKKNG